MDPTIPRPRRHGRTGNRDRSKLPLYCNCVGWSPDELPALEHLIEHGREIKLSSFKRHVNPDDFVELQQSLGYGHLKLEDDYCVRYYKCDGVVYMTHSAIEYVFATEDQIKALL